MRVTCGEIPIPLGDYPTLPEGSRVINPGEWAYGRYLYAAVDVSQGIVLAAHNDETRDGILGYFSYVSPENEADARVRSADVHTDAFVEAVSLIERLGQPNDTHVWLGGAADHSDLLREMDDIIYRDRHYAYDTVQRIMLAHAIPLGHLSKTWNGEQGSMLVELNNPASVLLISHVQS